MLSQSSSLACCFGLDVTLSETFSSFPQVRSISGVSYVEADGSVVMQAAGEKLKEPEIPEWNLDRVNQRDMPLDGNSDYAGKI